MASLVKKQDYYSSHFSAMASPCEILIDSCDENVVSTAVDLAEQEALRIEQAFSRYRQDNIIWQINSGKKVTVDEETARLLDYAGHLFQLSDGLFDVTAGVLRKAWKFDGSDNIPDQKQIDSLLPFIGWDKVQWNNPVIQLPEGMEIDLGGIGKEYAVDRTAHIIQSYLTTQKVDASVLVNFGGDITVLGPVNRDGRSWNIGVDTGIDGYSNNDGQILLSLTQGGVATSGNSRRYLQKGQQRYSHILDPRSGWPVSNSPASVTVAANTCTDAGMLSTLALLQGAEAESFLKAQGVNYWLQW